MSSIQEIENINPDTLKDTPDILITYSEELLINKKYEKAIEFREKAIKFSIEKFGGENNIKCAPFYVSYADALIIKIMETQDLFNNNLEKEDDDENKKEKETKQTNNIEPIKGIFKFLFNKKY